MQFVTEKNSDVMNPFSQRLFVCRERDGQAYPELGQNADAVKKIILNEEEKFFETLENGLKLLEAKTKNLATKSTLSGAVAFQLYDTYRICLRPHRSDFKGTGLSARPRRI